MLNTTQKITASLVLLILDFLWIYLFMGARYKILVGNIQGTEMKLNVFYGIVAYTLMLIGLHKFVLPLIKTGSIQECLSTAFVFGIILYGVYDFTAGSIFKKWDINLALIDILWGGFVYFMACYSTNLIN